MTAERLLAELKDKGVVLAANGNDLLVTAPKGVITDELHEELSNCKQDLLSLVVASEPATGNTAIEATPSSDSDPPTWVLRIEEVYQRVVDAGVNLWLDGDGKLRINSSAPAEIKQRVRDRKEDLLDFFTWAEAKANWLNQIFKEQGATGERARITGATVRDGHVKRWRKSKANIEPRIGEQLADSECAGDEDGERHDATWAHAMLAKTGVRLLEVDGVFTVGIWSDLDSPDIRAALRCFHGYDPPVRYLDGSGIPDRYKLRHVAGDPVPLNVLHAMEQNPAEPWAVRDRMLAEMGWADSEPEAAPRDINSRGDWGNV